MPSRMRVASKLMQSLRTRVALGAECPSESGKT